MDAVRQSPIINFVREHTRQWPRNAVVVVSVILLVLIALRMAAPFILKSQINDRLAAIPGYHGHVDEVSLSLFRGAYSMEGFAIEKTGGRVPLPFVTAENIDFSLAWRELVRGRVVSDIALEKPRLNIVQAKSPAADQPVEEVADQRWQDVINDLFPIEITHLEMTNGELHFTAPDRDPPVDIFVKEMKVTARGLRNRPDSEASGYPATLLAEGVTSGEGKLALSTELEPLADQPHFHLVLKIDQLNLPTLNPFLRSYLNIDVRAGEFTGYLEMTARDGRFDGYFKPFFEDLDFNNTAVDEEKNIFTRLWENIVEVFASLVTNRNTEKVALRIPFEGEFGETDVGTWESLRTLLRNGFIKALEEGLDGRHENQEIPTPSNPDADK